MGRKSREKRERANDPLAWIDRACDEKRLSPDDERKLRALLTRTKPPCDMQWTEDPRFPVPGERIWWSERIWRL